MEYRVIPGTELSASVIGLGCARFASASSGRRPEEVVSAVREAIQQGINFFDTADSYGQGDSERMLGASLKGERHRVVIATKVGYTFGIAGGLTRYVKPLAKQLVRLIPGADRMIRNARSAAVTQDFSPEHIRRSVEGSLQRLGTDYIDFLLLHDPPREIVNREPVVDAVHTLIAAGKIRYFGISCRIAEDHTVFSSMPLVCALQLPINLWEVADLSELTKASLPIFARETFARDRIDHLPSEVAELLRQAGLSPRRAALRHVLRQPGVTVALIGMTQRAHVIDNCMSLTGPDLPPDVMDALDAWRRAGAIHSLNPQSQAQGVALGQ